MKNLFAVLFLLLILVSCKKDPSAPLDPTVGFCGLASISNESNKMISSFEYGPDQQIRKVVTYDTTTGNIRFYAEYNYSTHQINKNYINGGGNMMYTSIYLLNGQGLPGMKINVLPSRSDTTWFTYDSDGYLIRSIRRLWDSYDTLHYSYKEGKRTTILNPNIFPAVDTIKYEYYDFELQPNTYALMYSHYEIMDDPAENELYLGKNTRLAVKSKVNSSMNAPQHSVHYQYFYDFDADSNLTKIRGTIGYLNSYTFHSFEHNVKVECK